jgi:integrase
LLVLGFAGALRRSELVALDADDLEESPEGLHVRIKQSKTDQEGAGDFVSIPHGSRLRPVAAIKEWLEAAAITEGSVFRSIKKGGLLTSERLRDQSVAEILKRRAETAGFDPPSSQVTACGPASLHQPCITVPIFSASWT